MPQLPRTYLEKPLPRSAGAASSPGVPRAPQVDTRAVQQGFGALGNVGDSLTKLALLISDTDKKVDTAELVATRAQKLSLFYEAMGQEEESVTSDQSIPPLLRDENLKFRMEERREELLEDVADDTLRLQLEGEMREELARRSRDIRTQGRAEFVKGAAQGIETTTQQLQAQYLTTQDPLARQQIRQTQSELYSQGEAAGIFVAGTTGTKMQSYEEESRTAEAHALVLAHPEMAEQHFKLLAEGKPGLPGLPEHPPEKLPALSQAARAEVDHQYKRAEQVRLHGERALDKAHDTNRVTLSAQIENATSQGELDRLLRVVQAAGADAGAQGVSREGFESLQGDIRRRRNTLDEDAKARAASVKSNPAVLVPLDRAVVLGRGQRNTGQIYAEINRINQAVESGQLLWKDAKPLLEDLKKELSDDHPVNNTVAQQERTGLIKTFQARSEFGQLDEEELALQNLMLRQYDDAIQGVYNRGDYGGGNEAVSREAPQIRRDLEDTYNEKTVGVLRKRLFQTPPALPPGLIDEGSLGDEPSRSDVERAFGEADVRLHEAVQSGRYTQEQALAYKVLLDRRKTDWEQLSRRQPSKAAPKKTRGSVADQLGFPR
jgi:hypothetical protein